MTGEYWWGRPAVSGYEEFTDPAKKGVLDLRAPVVVEGTGDAQTTTEIKKVIIGKLAFGSGTVSDVAYTLASEHMTEFYCDVVDGIVVCDNFSNDANLKKVEIGGPAESIGHLVFVSDPELKDIKMNFPKLRSIGENWEFFGGESSTTKPNAIDVQTILNPDVTNICKQIFTHSCVSGDLVLSNIWNIGEQAFYKASLTSVYLKGSLAELPMLVFASYDNGVATITNVVFDLPNLTTVSSSAFGTQPYIRALELQNVTSVWDMGLVTNILAEAAGGGLHKNLGEEAGMIKGQDWIPNDLRIYVSKKQWTPSEKETYSASNPTGIFLGKETFTEKEKEMIAGDPTLAKAFGVLVIAYEENGETKVQRKAFFVDKRSVHDKMPGLSVIVR